MKTELDKAINKLKEVSERTQTSHLFQFNSNLVSFHVENTGNSSIWFIGSVLILGPLLHLGYYFYFVEFSWQVLLVDLSIPFFGLRTLFKECILNRQVVKINPKENYIDLLNTYYQLSSIQQPKRIPFDEIGRVDVREVRTGRSWWERHQQLFFLNHSEEVIAYVNLCPSLEERAISTSIKRVLNAFVARK